MKSLNDDLRLALRLADAAAEVGLQYFSQGTDAQMKADGTPVTAADFAVERLLVEAVTSQRPDDGILSEEGATRYGKRRWIFDPIDGTVNFAAGDPEWGTHIALQDDHGELLLGVITRPVYGSRWWATRGGGAFRDRAGSDEAPQRLRTSQVRELRDARATMWPSDPCELRSALEQSACWVDPDFTVALQLLDGRIDLVVARAGGIWDHAPAVILTEEAGGCFRDPAGGHRLDLNGGIFTNGHIDHALATLLHW